MAKQRHTGFVIFGICSALSARLAFFEPKPHVLTPAEERWGASYRDEGDPLRLIHGFRYYIYGLGVIGLLIVVEDLFSAKMREKKQPKPMPQQTAATTPVSSVISDPNTPPPVTPSFGGRG